MSELTRSMTLDQLTRICGYFSIESSINNYYNCLHPDNEDKELDEETGKMIGKCIHFYCPLASDLEEDDFEGFSGDHRMQLIILPSEFRIKEKAEG